MHHENQCGEPLYKLSVADFGFIVFKVQREWRKMIASNGRPRSHASWYTVGKKIPPKKLLQLFYLTIDSNSDTIFELPDTDWHNRISILTQFDDLEKSTSKKSASNK